MFFFFDAAAAAGPTLRAQLSLKAFDVLKAAVMRFLRQRVLVKDKPPQLTCSLPTYPAE